MATKRIGSDPLDDLVPTRGRRSTKSRTTRTVDRKPLTKKPAPAEASWDANNKRVTFHCPLYMEGLIEQEVRNSGRSKSRVIVDAIKQHLKINR